MAKSQEHVPTSKTRSDVTEMSKVGIPQEDIARAIGITKPTLEKHYRDELDTAATKANTMVAGKLFEMAMSGECPAATIFWCKTRLGWRETDKITAENTQPTKIKFVIEGDTRPIKEISVDDASSSDS